LIDAKFEVESKPGEGTSIFVTYRRPESAASQP
jgi:hypothetical protein